MRSVKPRILEPSASISLSDRPLAGSSSSRSCGSAIRARASAVRFCIGVGQ